MKTLTDQQRRAVDARGASVALGAGAGCGKTTVLTARFVAALTDTPRVPLGRIVALTFTDKAAAELRRRVRDACRRKLDEGDDPGYWRGVLLGLEAAPICTFHTFCGAIVRRFALRVGVDPGFAILDEPLAATAREEAVDAAIRRALIDRDDDLTAAAVEFGLGSVRSMLVGLLADRSAPDLARWGSTDPDALVETWRAAFDRDARPATLARFAREARPCVELARDRRAGFPTKMAEAIAALASIGDGVGMDRDPLASLRELRGFAMMPRGLLAPKWPDPTLYDVCKETFESFRKLADDCVAALSPAEGRSADAAAMGVRLARLGARAWSELAGLKLRRGALDFNDLLLKARALLDDGPVLDDLAGRYDLIFVDEFQDTDPVQDEVIRRIAGADLDGGRLYLVGDLKQSIYGFRGALPKLFTQYRGEFPESGRLPLSENFRSRPAILRFVNALFDDAFEEPYEPLVAGQADPLPPSLPAVVFAWPEAAVEPRPGRRDVDADRKAEAGRLARLVRSWLDEGRPVFDKEAECVRPIEPRDVAMLFRTLNDAQHYERALADEGVEYYVQGGSAFYAQQEVQDLINVLAVLDDPHDPVSLAGALRSPFFALSDEALYWLTTVRPGDLAAGLERCDEATLPDLTPVDRHRARRAATLLSRWRSFKDREPIGALLDRVLDESGYEAGLLGEPLGDRKRANARKLVRMARSFDARGGYGLADLVARLRADLNDPPDEEQAATTGELGQAVRLLTVHKAKGLEFPVVILPDLDRPRHQRSKPIVVDPALGPLVKVGAPADPGDDEAEADPGTSLGLVVHKAIRREQDEAESLRVFYVAATRARDLLVLSTGGDPAARPRSAALGLLRRRFDVQTGLRLDATGAGETPAVTVVRGAPTGPPGRKARGSRPPILEVAGLIESTRPDPTPEPARPRLAAARPRHLSVDPSSTLAPADARLDRLVRAILLDPRALRRGALAEVAAGAGRRQVPLASPRLVAEAIGRARHWVEGPLGRQVAGAAEVRRDLEWSVAWPEGEGEGSTTIEGRVDLAHRDRDGAWTLIQVADASAPAGLERLRAALSIRLAPRLGLGPVARAWQLRHGPDGGLSGIDPLDDDAIDALLAAAPG